MSMNSQNNIIQVQNVSFAYKSGSKILSAVSLDVAKGQIFGLLGPNGGGKTTLFKIISSLIRNYDGSVIIDGLDQKKNLREVLCRMGVVFQSPSLDKKLTIEENLIYQGALYGLSHKESLSRMDSLLETFSISARRKDLVGELSGGLARRAEIVKSLLHSPKILLMDEPSTGLDMAVRLDLWNLLHHVRTTQSVTILLTTHFVEEADRCDRIAILDRGSVICSGIPSELKQKLTFKQFHIKPKNLSVTKDFLTTQFQIPFAEKNEHLHFKSNSTEQADKLTLALSPYVDEITCREPSLEDVFLHHTGREMMGS